MAWETRNGTGRYLYRCRRVAGRVTREYVGRGHLAELIAAGDASLRALRLAERAAWDAERVRLEALDATVADLDRLVTATLRAYLTLAGYRQHDRGEWRKTRDHAA